MNDDFLKWTGLVHLEYDGMTVLSSDISRRLVIYHAITSPGGSFKLNATLRNEPSGIVVSNTGTFIKVNQSPLSISSKITHITAYTTTGFNDMLINILSY